jgi:hypothetical protein
MDMGAASKKLPDSVTLEEAGCMDLHEGVA